MRVILQSKNASTGGKRALNQALLPTQQQIVYMCAVFKTSVGRQRLLERSQNRSFGWKKMFPILMGQG